MLDELPLGRRGVVVELEFFVHEEFIVQLHELVEFEQLVLKLQYIIIELEQRHDGAMQ